MDQSAESSSLTCWWIPPCECKCLLFCGLCCKSVAELACGVIKTVSRYQVDEEDDSCECCMCTYTKYSFHCCEGLIVIHNPCVYHRIRKAMHKKRQQQRQQYTAELDAAASPQQEQMSLWVPNSTSKIDA